MRNKRARFKIRLIKVRGLLNACFEFLFRLRISLGLDKQHTKVVERFGIVSTNAYWFFQILSAAIGLTATGIEHSSLQDPRALCRPPVRETFLLRRDFPAACRHSPNSGTRWRGQAATLGTAESFGSPRQHFLFARRACRDCSRPRDSSASI